MAFGYAEFTKFTRQNPHVYVALKDAAQKLRANGAERAAIWQIGQDLRWDDSLDTDRLAFPDGFKVPNGCWAFYARALMALGAVPYGFFDTRPMKHEPTWWINFVARQEAG